jgi:predicted component of viral defense system (DUF524 family)
MTFFSATAVIIKSGSAELALVAEPQASQDASGAPDYEATYAGAKLAFVGKWHDGEVTSETRMAYVPEPAPAFVAPLQMLEETAYLVSLRSPTRARLRIPAPGVGGRNPLQLLRFADGSPNVLRGILNWGSHVGQARLVATGKDFALELPVEVRSKKIGYLNEYCELLEDLARHSSRLVADYASTTTVPFQPRDPMSSFLMEKFLLLEAAFADGWLPAAVETILQRPTTRLSRIRDTVDLASAREIDAISILQLTQSGDWSIYRGLQKIPTTISKKGVAYGPSRVSVPMHTLSHETPENRMVRYIFEFLDELLHTLEARPQLNDFSRDRCREFRDFTAAWLSDDRFAAFAGWRPPPQTPNTVLLRRDGYRELYQLYLSLQLAGALRWEDAEILYGQSVRPLSELYEMWTVITLALALREEFLPSVDFRLFSGKTVLRLRRGHEPVMTFAVGSTTCKLYNNREYSYGRTGPYASYSRPYTPDLTLAAETSSGKKLLLAFDAKYRYREASEIFGAGGAEAAEASDLMKMHTYRDALGNCGGAYVLFPGSATGANAATIFRKGDQPFPSVGAFALRPVRAALQIRYLVDFIKAALVDWAGA